MTTQDSRVRILVVEDDPHIQILLRHFLRARFDIEIVGTVDEALRTAAVQRFDLFLLDINLGEHRTGVDLLQSLREMPDYQGTQAIACTAYVLHSNEGHFFSKGFNGYLDKPFTREMLLKLVDDVLEVEPSAPVAASAPLRPARPAQPHTEHLRLSLAV